MDYDLELLVKYKNIEEELIEKFNNNEEDLGYTKEDVYQICDELYKYELLSFFKVNAIQDKKVQYSLSDIWKKINNYPNFIKVIEKYKEKITLMDAEQTFILMFNYSLFYYLHPCIIAMFKQDFVLLEQLLIKLEEKI